MINSNELIRNFAKQVSERVSALDKDRTLLHPVREARKKEAKRSLQRLEQIAANLLEAAKAKEKEPKTDSYSDYLRDK